MGVFFSNQASSQKYNKDPYKQKGNNAWDTDPYKSENQNSSESDKKYIYWYSFNTFACPFYTYDPSVSGSQEKAKRQCENDCRVSSIDKNSDSMYKNKPCTSYIDRKGTVLQGCN